MEGWALGVSILALLVSIGSVAAAVRQLKLARDTNSMPVLIEMFREHRSAYLADAREYVRTSLSGRDLSHGLASIPKARRQKQVRDLLWFYDNIGVMVVHEIVDIEIVSGYLGGSALAIWKELRPMIEAERQRRRDAGDPDPERWQDYFERLTVAIASSPPELSRSLV